jgi:hypothetical protein
VSVSVGASVVVRGGTGASAVDRPAARRGASRAGKDFFGTSRSPFDRSDVGSYGWNRPPGRGREAIATAAKSG